MRKITEKHFLTSHDERGQFNSCCRESQVAHSLLSTYREIFAKLTFITFSLLILSLIYSSSAIAHRSARTEIDTCRISVGDEVVHFAAYTPLLTPGDSYCHIIPEVGLTHLVIDYEGSKLRKTTVEFEITKEPEGTRVFYQEPIKIKKGSLDAKIDFTGFGAGHYMTHITILYEGDKLDTHLPFSVGIEVEETFPYKLVIPIVLFFVTLIVVKIKVKSRDHSLDDRIDD